MDEMIWIIGLCLKIRQWVRVGERGRIEMKQDWPCVDGY